MEIPYSLPHKLKAAMAPSSTGANTNQNDPLQHPLEAISQGIQGITQGEARAPRLSHMGSANEGPADIIAKVSGSVQGGKREDDGPYFTNNEGECPEVYVRHKLTGYKAFRSRTLRTAKPLAEFL
jgi:catalase